MVAVAGGDESGILKGVQCLISDEIPISTPLARSSQLGSERVYVTTMS